MAKKYMKFVVGLVAAMLVILVGTELHRNWRRATPSNNASRTMPGASWKWKQHDMWYKPYSDMSNYQSFGSIQPTQPRSLTLHPNALNHTDYFQSGSSHKALTGVAKKRTRNRSRTPQVKCTETILSPQTIAGVEKLVFFVGYSRSGHSIIGSMMDAHPNMVIAHEFMLFRQLTKAPGLHTCKATWAKSKSTLFNALYQKSKEDACAGWRQSDKEGKGYNLKVETPWQGGFDDTLKVIGDKSGGHVVMAYRRDKEIFGEALSILKNLSKIPIRIIHVVRNPYDMIATNALYHSKVKKRHSQGELNTSMLKDNQHVTRHIAHHLNLCTGLLFHLAETVPEVINTYNLTVLEIHHSDFVKDPKHTLTRICSFLALPCPEDYLQACQNKAYRTLSKTRNLVAWPEKVLARVESGIQKLSFFRRYSFVSD